MCGILGIINHKNKSKDLINNFSISLNYSNHRGPDDKKIVSFENNIFGFTRLAIIDLTNNGMQPFEDENSILVFNGEIYNFLKLKIELQGLNIQFKSNSDGEVLKKYIDYFGIETSLKKN